MIKLENISKTFRISKREKGLLASFKSLFIRKYTYKKALNNISFEIADGEIVGYLGPNGAGKSTTIKIMSGILVPDKGGVCEINSYVPWKDRIKFVREIGVVFGQRTQLWWDVPVIDSLELLRDIYKLKQAEFEQTLNELTQLLSLEEILNIPLRQLSLGQRMKCEIAASLIHKPKILFLDEPTIGLDAVSKLAVRNMIKNINKKLNITVILTTHDMDDVNALASRIILIGKGEILYDGQFSEIKGKYNQTKTIKVEFVKNYEDVSLKDFEIVSKHENLVTYKNLKPFNLKNFITQASAAYEIKDVDVEEPSIEEIIAKMYSEYGI